MAEMPADAQEKIAQQRGERQQVVIGNKPFALKNLPGLAFLAVMTVYFLTPIYWLFVASTKSSTDLYGTYGLWFSHFNLFQNLSKLATFQNSVYLHWIGNTILYAVVGGAAGTFIAVLAGYALAKYQFRGNGLVFGLVLGAALVPQTTLALPIFLLESKLGLANTYWAVLLPSLLSPFGVFLARIYAKASIPDDLIQAARVDGASEPRIFWSVCLPILTPGMITIFLFQFVAIWNSFFLPLIVLSDPNLFPVNLGLATWNLDPASHEVLFNLIVTGSFVSVLPLIVLFLLLQRYWRSGLTFGSLVG